MHHALSTAAALLLVGAAAAQATSSPCFESSLGTNLGLTDDSVAPNNALGFTFPGPAGPVTAIDIASNGFVWLGSNPSSACCSGYLTGFGGFLTDTPRIAPLWVDLNPSAGGGVFFNTFPATSSTPARAVVTWDQVPEFGGTVPFTVQLQLAADGSFTFWYDDNVSVTNFHDVVTGVTEGVNATANGIDISALVTSGPHNSGTNPTVHELQIGTFDFAAGSIEFLPNGLGGYLVFDRSVCAPASARPFGRGCPQPAVAYELFDTTSTIDLSNTSIDFLPQGNGYVAVPGSGFFAGTTSAIVSGDDVVTDQTLPWPFPFAGGTTTTIGISSNGFIWLQGGQFNSRCCFGDVFAFLNDPASIAVLWQDLNPNSGGSVFFDVEPGNAAVHITWSNVPEYFNTGANTAQISLYPSGAFRLSWQTVANVSHDCLVGLSEGNGAADPGPTDFSTAVPFATGSGGLPLALGRQPGTRPQLGTTFVMTVDSIANGSVLGVMVLGFTPVVPPLDLSVVGMPGCFQHVSIGTSVIFGVNPAPATFSLGIPNNQALTGMHVFAQAATLTPAANPLGVLASNGLDLRVGN